MSDLGGFSLWELFQGEVESQMKGFTDAMLALEAGEAPAVHLAAAMRAAHSAKGAARLVELGPGVRLAHGMEDCLVAAQNGALPLTRERVDVLLASADLLSRLSQTSEIALPGWLVEHTQAVEQMVTRLDSLRAGELAVPAPPPAAPARESEPHQAYDSEATHEATHSSGAPTRTLRQAHATTPPAAAVLVCLAGRERYGLDVADVVEVVPAVPLRPLPGTPATVAGLCRYRGGLVPVLDLSQMLGGAPAALRYNTRIVIVGYRGKTGSHHLLGLLAEGVDHGAEATWGRATSGVSTPGMPFLGQLTEDAGGVVQLLTVDRLVADDLRERLFAEA